MGLTAGLLGGTVRQIDWLMPILAPGFLLVRHGTFRRPRPAIVPLTVSAAVALGGAVAFSAWFNDQPYAIPEKAFEGVTLLFTDARGPALLCTTLVYMMQTAGIMMFPLLIAVPLLYRRWFGGPLDAWLRLTNAILLVPFIWFVGSLCYGGRWVFSWFGNTFVPFSYMSGTAPAPPSWFHNNLPTSFWTALQLTITAVVCGGLSLSIVTHVWPRRKNAKKQFRERIPAVMGLLLVFSAVYVPLLLSKAVAPAGIYDRYLLPLFPLGTIGFLRGFRQWMGRDRMPLASWFVLALFGFYGVAESHDYFAQLAGWP